MGSLTSDDHLRQHIHQLLYNYAKTHLTTDHIAFTSIIFTQVIPVIHRKTSTSRSDLYPQLQPHLLKEVPLADPAAFTLPTDPFNVLFKLHSIDQLPRYEERFRANREATMLLKQHLRTRSGAPKTERIIYEDERMNPYLPIYALFALNLVA